MTFAFISRFALICTIISAMLLADISVASPTQKSDDSSKRREIYGEVGFTSLITITIISLGRWLTPLDEWEAEIRKLTEDELFVERWMLLNDDPASLEKGKRAITKIQEQRKVVEKKRKRFLWWYYPTITTIGTGVMMLIFGLQRD